MSIYNCHKQQPQPWMSYIASDKPCYQGGCCPVLITDRTHLLPFQIISNGAFMKIEISPYGEDDWTIITIPYSEVSIDGFYIISYDGSAIDELECGAYDFRLTAGEVWYFETITIKEFEDTENAYTIRDDLMLPFKFSEQQFETLPLIAQCDEIMPFMFSTKNATSGTVTVYLYDVINECTVEELDIDVTVLTISGKTYYIFDGECIYPFFECGLYKLEIVDGEHSYFSVPFSVECDISDIPDGYRVMLDFNRCVMRNETGEIMYEECSDIPGTAVYEDMIISDVSNATLEHYSAFYGEGLHFLQGFKLYSSKLLYSITLPYPDPLPRYFGNPDYNVKISIFTAVAGLPVNLVADNISVVHSTTWMSEHSISFYFADINLSAGDYCFVITFQDVILFDEFNYLDIHSSTLSTYADGKRGVKAASSPTWTLSTTTDLRSFITFVTYI